MIKWGINPPMWRFADTLLLYKTIICPNEKAALTELVSRYARLSDEETDTVLARSRWAEITAYETTR